MTASFRIGGGRWSAVVKKVAPGAFEDPERVLGVEISCDSEQVIRFGFCPAGQHAADPNGNGPASVLAYAGLFGFDLSDVDLWDLLYLVAATDALCQHLHDGGSVERWCATQGLRPLRDKKVRRRPNRRSALVIRTKEWMFILPPQESSGTRGLRGGIGR